MLDLPTEILLKITLKLHSSAELASLCRTCRPLNSLVTPILYSHTVLDIYDGAIYENPVPVWLAALNALCSDARFQCDAVQKLTVNGELDDPFLEGNKTPVNVNAVAELINKLLIPAVGRMRRLSNFTWNLNIFPRDNLLTVLSQKPIETFSCHFGTFQAQSETIAHPNFSILFSCPLTSLTTHLVSNTAVVSTQHLLEAHRNKLKSLRLILPTQKHTPEKCRFYSMPECMYLSGITLGDHLQPLIQPLLDINISLHLEELELHHVERIKMSNLAQVINFRCLRRFCLVDSNIHYMEDGAEIWNTLASLADSQTTIPKPLSLTHITTDVEYEELSSFIGSFSGLETLLLCDVDKRFLVDYYSLIPNLSNHFLSLRRLFIPRNVHGFHYLYPKEMKRIISGCPHLEELGWGMRRENQREMLSLVLTSPTLHSIYIVCSGASYKDPPIAPDVFIKDFLTYSTTRARNNLGVELFVRRLRKISFGRSIWGFVPASLVTGSGGQDVVMAMTCWGKTVLESRWEDFKEDEMVERVGSYVWNSCWGALHEGGKEGGGERRTTNRKSAKEMKKRTAPKEETTMLTSKRMAKWCQSCITS